MREPGEAGRYYLGMTTNKSTPRLLLKAPRSKSALIGSATSARREKALLRRSRERLQDEPRADESSARSSVAARRLPSA